MKKKKKQKIRYQMVRNELYLLLNDIDVATELMTEKEVELFFRELSDFIP